MGRTLLDEIIQWDVRSWSRALSYWDQTIDWDKVENGLELGGRQGGLSLWLALKGKRTVCSDLKDVRATAGGLHSRFNLSPLIEYRDIDATNIPYENCFDIIVFKSIIGGIGRNGDAQKQQKVFNEIHKALKPGGKLLFAENLVASPVHQRLRRAFVDWANSWRYISIGEMEGFLKDFSAYDLRTTAVLATFGRNEAQRRILSAIDDFVFNKFCPERWRYIAYGIAQK